MRTVNLHPEFALHAAKLADLHNELVNSPRLYRSTLPKDKILSGVYLLSERDVNLYVGRSNNIRYRMALHCRPNSDANSASFAFLLAKSASTLDLSAKDRKEIVELLGQEFVEEKQRVEAMDVRSVEVADPVTQALLEVYSAVTLGTPHNSFENH